MERIIVLLILILFAINSFAMDIGCVVGGCENKAEAEQKEMYECVCPSKDTVGTILDVIGVLTLPFELISKKPYLHAAASGIEGLIKRGCKCKPKAKKDNDNYNFINQDVNQEQLQLNATNNLEK